MTGTEDAESRFLVRVVGPDGAVVGVGALVGTAEVITCAHVVNAALGLDRTSPNQPTGPVTVEFPLLPGQPQVEARVRQWWPPPRPGTAGDDIAGLEVTGGLPDDARPARLAVEVPRPGQTVRAFGYPGSPPRPAGAWVAVSVRGRVGGGLLQLESGTDAALRVQPGYSGAPVIDAGSGRVVGMLAQAAPGRTAERDSYAVGTDRLRLAWPQALDRRGLASVPARTRDRLTVLHVSDPQFGKHHHPPFDRLPDDLAGLAGRHELRPDLIVVTGDLTERGVPGELATAFRFLAELAEAVELPRHRIAVVPGNHDVNRKACESYFAGAAADEREPEPPYYPKWEKFQTAFEDFYRDVPGVTFSPDEPWSLFELADLNVVVAGLNSTMDESHRDQDHYGWLGQAQLHWFARRLTGYRERGWLRLAAVHHNVVPGAASDDENLRDADNLDRYLGESRLANLLLHGHARDGRLHRFGSGLVALAAGSAAVEPAARPSEVPSQCQLITITPDGFTRHARQYDPGQRRWIGDTRISRTSSDWTVPEPYQLTGVDATFPPPEQPDEGQGWRPDRRGFEPDDADGLLALVAEATRIRHPDATVATRPEAGYLRVTHPLPGGGVEMWPVGVVDTATAHLDEAVDRFATSVHALFAAANRHVPSRLVYTGEPAPVPLVQRTERNGVRLQRFADYQGLLNLDPFVARQAEQLATDPLYPAELYVPQRYRLVHPHGGEVHDDLAEWVIDCLRADDARFVMVLGDFGRGKTALLRQLARTLPETLPELRPILVELRSLEKAPTLDELLGAHLLRHEVQDLHMEKLRYMIRNGRLALLFDGFDELELRVGYDNAADYLATLLASVAEDTRAKVVLTSRTQHFRSINQVRTALGERVAARAGSRIVELADLNEDQILRFLATRYRGDRDKANARFRLLHEVEDLLGLAHNPRMLEFIAALDEQRLRAVQRREGRISAAELYRELVDFWLASEVGRQRHERGVPSLDERERLAACTELANRLWASTSPTIPESALSATVSATLTRLAERNYTPEQAAHSVGSGSLLVRTEESTFTFVHQSIMEWLVAAAVATDLHDRGGSDRLGERPLSPLMADFLADLAGHDLATRWATGMVADPDASETTKQNALLVAQRILGRTVFIPRAAATDRTDLVRVDLRGLDLASYDLQGADLRRATLRGMRLDGIDLTGADLREADFTGARLTGGSLREAWLHQSVWDRAALLDVDGVTASADRPELANAAIPGRDPATVQVPAGAGPATCVAFSADGTLLAVGRGSAVEIVDIADGRAVRVLTGHSDWVTAVAYAPDSTQIATGSDDGTARIWDLHTGQHLTTLTGHIGAVTGIAYAPDSTHIATGSHDGTARIWDLHTGQHLTTLTGHTGAVTGIAYAPDGAQIATASGDHTARIWNPHTGQHLTTLTGHTDPVTGIAYAPDSAHIATGSHDDTACIWNPHTGQHLTTLSGHTGWLTGIAYAPDSTHIATTSDDGTARIWNPHTGQHLTTLSGHTRPLTTIAHAPNRAHIATGSHDHTARIWNPHTGQHLTTLSGHTGWVTAVAYSPDRAHIATGSHDHTARIWNALSGKHLITLSGHTRAVMAIAYSPDSTQITTGSDDHTARIWNPHTGQHLTTLSGHTRAVTAIAYSPDGAQIATGSWDREARIWSPYTGQHLTTLSGHIGPVTGIAYAPDGTRIATTSVDHTARIWNPDTGQLLTTLSGHTRAVTSIAYAPDRDQVATGSHDHTARIWKPDTGQLLTTLSGHTRHITGITYTPDGSQIATTSWDGTVRIWDPRTGAALATLVPLPRDGYAVLLPDGSYKLEGEPGEILWWAVKLCRFAPGKLDPYVPGLRRLPPDHPIAS